MGLLNTMITSYCYQLHSLHSVCNNYIHALCGYIPSSLFSSSSFICSKLAVTSLSCLATSPSSFLTASSCFSFPLSSSANLFLWRKPRAIFCSMVAAWCCLLKHSSNRPTCQCFRNSLDKLRQEWSYCTTSILCAAILSLCADRASCVHLSLYKFIATWFNYVALD